jgi:hypothetical protein
MKGFLEGVPLRKTGDRQHIEQYAVFLFPVQDIFLYYV